MALDFPEIVTYESALRFALRAEQACADLAASAGVLAPTQEWQDKLEEVVCTHDDRVQKLTAAWQEAAGTTATAIVSLDPNDYLGALGADPATSWPEVASQLVKAEQDAARYHDAFVTQCGETLSERARAFEKTAAQDRACAAELGEMLGRP